jgi:hypothetical protein
MLSPVGWASPAPLLSFTTISPESVLKRSYSDPREPTISFLICSASSPAACNFLISDALSFLILPPPPAPPSPPSDLPLFMQKTLAAALPKYPPAAPRSTAPSLDPKVKPAAPNATAQWAQWGQPGQADSQMAQMGTNGHKWGQPEQGQLLARNPLRLRAKPHRQPIAPQRRPRPGAARESLVTTHKNILSPFSSATSRISAPPNLDCRVANKAE